MGVSRHNVPIPTGPQPCPPALHLTCCPEPAAPLPRRSPLLSPASPFPSLPGPDSGPQGGTLCLQLCSHSSARKPRGGSIPREHSQIRPGGTQAALQGKTRALLQHGGPRGQRTTSDLPATKAPGLQNSTVREDEGSRSRAGVGAGRYCPVLGQLVHKANRWRQAAWADMGVHWSLTAALKGAHVSSGTHPVVFG